jgi:hypothetical protein
VFSTPLLPLAKGRQQKITTPPPTSGTYICARPRQAPRKARLIFVCFSFPLEFVHRVFRACLSKGSSKTPQLFLGKNKGQKKEEEGGTDFFSETS